MVSSTKEEEKVPVKLDLNDHASVRRELQDHAIEAAEVSGYKASYMADNIRILLGLCTIATVGVTHLFRGKVQEQFMPLVACVATYYALVTITMLFSWFYVQDNFVETVAAPASEKPSIRMKLNFPRYATHFTLSVTGQGRKYDTKSTSVAEFFHADGYIAAPKYQTFVTGALQQFESTRTKKA